MFAFVFFQVTKLHGCFSKKKRRGHEKRTNGVVYRNRSVCVYTYTQENSFKNRRPQYHGSEINISGVSPSLPNRIKRTDARFQNRILWTLCALCFVSRFDELKKKMFSAATTSLIIIKNTSRIY